MAVRAADEEGDLGHRLVAPAFHAAGEGRAVQNLAATIECHDDGFVRNRAEQQFAFALHQLGGRQLLLLLELAERERPADAAGIVLVEVTLGAASGAADGGDGELHAGQLLSIGAQAGRAAGRRRVRAGSPRRRGTVAGLAAASVSSCHIFSSA